MNQSNGSAGTAMAREVGALESELHSSSSSISELFSRVDYLESSMHGVLRPQPPAAPSPSPVGNSLPVAGVPPSPLVAEVRGQNARLGQLIERLDSLRARLEA